MATKRPRMHMGERDMPPTPLAKPDLVTLALWDFYALLTYPKESLTVVFAGQKLITESLSVCAIG